MSLVASLIGFFIKQRAASKSYAELKADLKNSGEVLTQRLHSADDTPANRQAAAHVISIERWGTQRLSSLLDGSTPQMDDSNVYCPGADLDLAALASEFEKTRPATLALADRLEPYAGEKVQHNELGSLNVKTWLFYLCNHAQMESRRIK